jgi:hypothetical protein
MTQWNHTDELGEDAARRSGTIAVLVAGYPGKFAISGLAVTTGIAPKIQWPILPLSIERIFLLAFFVIVTVYAFEAPIRYVLELIHLPAAIFIRDLVTIIPLLMLLGYQISRRQVQAAFVVFAVIIAFHGLVGMIGNHSSFAAIYGAKALLGLLFGACAARPLTKYSRLILAFFVVLWAISIVGILLDDWYGDFPWKGLSTTIMDVDVDIHRKWGTTELERVSGFCRSSIHAAAMLSLIGLYILLYSRSRLIKLVVWAGTLFCLYLTTQKGAIGAFFIASGIAFFFLNKRLLVARMTVLILMAAMILLPIILPYYRMGEAHGTFSLGSFYDRVEMMWPGAWAIIDDHSWILGAGLGGIGGGQRLFATVVNSADNMFLFFYGYFGLFGFVYLMVLLVKLLHRPSPPDKLFHFATLFLIYIFADGIILSVVEDPLDAIFFGAAIQLLFVKRSAVAVTAGDAPVSTKKDRVLFRPLAKPATPVLHN